MSQVNYAGHGFEFPSLFDSIKSRFKRLIQPKQLDVVPHDWNDGDYLNVWLDNGVTLILQFKRCGEVKRSIKFANRRKMMRAGTFGILSLPTMQMDELITKSVIIDHSLAQSYAAMENKPLPALPEPIKVLPNQLARVSAPMPAIRTVHVPIDVRPDMAKPQEPAQATAQKQETHHESAERTQPIRVYSGRLMKNGTALVRSDDKSSRCFFVDIEDKKLGETRCWGKELESALHDSGAKNGDLISIEKWGKVACMVPKKVRQADGSFDEIEVQAHRNKWKLERLR